MVIMNQINNGLVSFKTKRCEKTMGSQLDTCMALRPSFDSIAGFAFLNQAHNEVGCLGSFAEVGTGRVTFRSWACLALLVLGRFRLLFPVVRSRLLYRTPSLSGPFLCLRDVEYIEQRTSLPDLQATVGLSYIFSFAWKTAGVFSYPQSYPSRSRFPQARTHF